MSMLFQNISVRLGGKQILDHASLEAREGRITGIVGPNGSGKSTLVKTLFGIVPRQSGEICLNGVNTAALSRRQISDQVGYVGQEIPCVFDFTVTEVVEMALYRGGGDSKRRVEETLMELNISHLAHSSILTLSGGERKLVFLARAVAQGTDAVVLDEPTNHLDIRHQLFILDYLKQSGKTVLLVLHDLNLAGLYCDELYVLQGGRVAASGPPETVLSPELIRRVYGVEAETTRDSQGGIRIFFRPNRAQWERPF